MNYKALITSPTLLVDEQKCRANIKRMAGKARKHNVEFRPHFKTHQSADIGKWFRDEDVTGITVSSVAMARYFGNNGWNDITIAFPVNIREMEAINKLAKEISLTILISDPDVMDELSIETESQIGVMIELDTGSGRTGFTTAQINEISRLISVISGIEHLKFKGFYSHPGHSYSARNKNEIQAIHDDVLLIISEVESGLSMDRDDYNICLGDTPCSSVATKFKGIDQLSPGNLVFYDLMQVHIGSCSIENIAIALACPVVAKYPSRNELVIHGGAVHLSKEQSRYNGISHYGRPVLLNEDGWKPSAENGYVKSLSQEHGIVTCTGEFINSVDIGDLIGILPVHSCLTADLMGRYLTLTGTTLSHIGANYK